MSVSLVCEVFYQMQDSAEMLQESKARLCRYIGEPIHVVGCMNANVKNNGQVAPLPLIFIQGEGPLLPRRNWLAEMKLDWQQICKMNINCTLHDVLDKYSMVF